MAIDDKNDEVPILIMVIFLQLCIKLPEGTWMTSETKPFVQLVGDDAHQKEVETKCYASEITQL